MLSVPCSVWPIRATKSPTPLDYEVFAHTVPYDGCMMNDDMMTDYRYGDLAVILIHRHMHTFVHNDIFHQRYPTTL